MRRRCVTSVTTTMNNTHTGTSRSGQKGNRSPFCACCAASLVLLFALQSETAASNRADLFRVSLPHAIALEPIASKELLGSSRSGYSAISLPAARVTSFASDARMRPPLPLTAPITREVAAMWQMKVPERVRPEALRVTYQLVGCDGTSNVLNAANAPNSTMSVSVEPLPPRIVSTEVETVILEDEDAQGERFDETPSLDVAPLDMETGGENADVDTPDAPPAAETNDDNAGANPSEVAFVPIETDGESVGAIPSPDEKKSNPAPLMVSERYHLVEGGLILHFTLDQITVSGSYCGTVAVSVSGW